MPVPTEFGPARNSRKRRRVNTSVAAGASPPAVTDAARPAGLHGIAYKSKISCVYVFTWEEHVGPRLVAAEAALGLEISHTLVIESV
jgi:hypothetical protein